jgi:Fe-Mn family superoxide dismutase
MAVEIAPLTMKPPRLDGLSQWLIESHYENNYGGAVRRLNAIDARLSKVDWSSASGFEIAGLKREQLVAAGSVLLHEIYFESLGGGGGDPTCPELTAALERDFGSVECWRNEFVAMGKALGGGSGWILLSWSDRLNRLMNQWAADHTHGVAKASPILALDMYEHAYHMDFGANAGRYVETFMRNVNWERVAARFRVAKNGQITPPLPGSDGVTATELYESLKLPSDAAPIVLDVRLKQDRQRGGLPGTPWCDMEKVDEWCGQLPRHRKIVVYCMYGFQVSQDTATALRARGYDAQILRGGISAWRGMGFPTEPL